MMRLMKDLSELSWQEVPLLHPLNRPKETGASDVSLPKHPQQKWLERWLQRVHYQMLL